MKNMYKILTVILIMCFLVSCGTYNPPVQSDSTEGITEAPTEVGSEGSGDETDESGMFTVTLMYNGLTYLPNEGVEITAKWTASDGKSVHTAPVGSNGIAKIDGLDGDYKVTLSGLPERFTYNPNRYTATNDNRSITIEIYDYTKIRSGGGSISNCAEITQMSTYRAQLSGENAAVFYTFKPTDSGTYTIESWVDTTEDSINPTIEIWNSITLKLSRTINGDSLGIAPSGEYTKNFRHVIQVSSSDVGQRFIFAVKATSKVGYPVNVDFAVKLDGGFSDDRERAKIMIPEAELERIDAPAGAKLVYPEVEVGTNKYLFKGSMYALNELDGYYHKINEATGEADGELLFAYVSAALTRYGLDTPITTMEYAGNKALTVSSGTENYKYFIEGMGIHGYFCVAEPVSGVYCPCRSKADHPGFCVEGCPSCHRECRNVTQEQYDAMLKGGYADYANSDGLCPVTEELKEFLQKFSVSQRYFNDGNGWIEYNSTSPIDAAEADQWLFACAYYEGFTNLD